MTSVFARTSPQAPSPFKGKSRRSDHRYAVRLNMQYRTSAGGLNPVWKAGRMHDLSVGGILIDIPEALPVSSTVELVMDCTGLYHGKPMVHRFMIGSVLRNDAQSAALCILIHEFRDVRTSVMPSRRTERTLAVA